MQAEETATEKARREASSPGTEETSADEEGASGTSSGGRGLGADARSSIAVKLRATV